MKDILIRHDDRYIECEINGLEVTFTYSDDPTNHLVLTLKNEDSYSELKKYMRNIYESHNDHSYEIACDVLQTSERDAFFTDDVGYVYSDLRTRDEIHKYLKEATDKVWLMRSCDIATGELDNEVARPAVERIMKTYSDIPRKGYNDWECGYWNGIMGALRWVLGEVKDYLDT